MIYARKKTVFSWIIYENYSPINGMLILKLTEDKMSKYQIFKKDVVTAMWR